MDLQILARIEALVTEREGMIAANKAREFKGEGPKYNEDFFNGIVQCLQELGGLGG